MLHFLDNFVTVRYVLNQVNMTVLTILLLMVVAPAVIGLCVFNEWFGGEANPLRPRFWRGVFRVEIGPGDMLIYRKAKVSPNPGPRAHDVNAAGDVFEYEVDKFWTVQDVLEDGRLVAVTRTGKQVYLTPEDERVRKARLLERLRYRSRFPSVEAA